MNVLGSISETEWEEFSLDHTEHQDFEMQQRGCSGLAVSTGGLSAGGGSDEGIEASSFFAAACKRNARMIPDLYIIIRLLSGFCLLTLFICLCYAWRECMTL
ncbi:hypothetical protein N7G274_006240 [Stereocaulon virgatum]|uniref:Uncharacterized protein n=1 Tax=Stereocaulon virgatum TaxID=373712 RepID=A0ABR4A4E7_9LECA